MGNKVKLGIIGIGNMGTGHANNIKNGYCPEIELVAVADINPARLEWARENLPESVARFDTAEAMLDSGLLDACIVAVPHYNHPTYVMACLERGIHPLSEKPAGVYTKQVREMNEAASKHPELKFAMMFNQRTNPLYIKMRELVRSGKYGQIRRVNWLITDWYRSQQYYDSGDWRATWTGEGGGVLMNQCPHQLDLLQWICGMPTMIDCHAHFGKWHDIEVEDDVSAYMEFPNGATGVFIASTGDACGSNRFEIQMDGAKIVCENNKLKLWEFEMFEQEYSRRSTTGSFGSLKTSYQEIEVEQPDIPQHAIVLNAWAGAILHGTPLIAGGFEGINGLSLDNAMRLSAFTRKEVSLPVDEDVYYGELMKRVAVSRPKSTGAAVFADTTGSYNGAK